MFIIKNYSKYLKINNKYLNYYKYYKANFNLNLNSELYNVHNGL